jgi:hypothetical protein
MRLTPLATLLFLASGFLGTLPASAEQADPQAEAPKKAPAPSIEEVRAAYKEKRDEDVVVLADRALHDITLSGDPDQRAPELHFWRGASLRRLGRNREALVALEESKSRGFRTPELHLELALVRRILGQPEEAERDFEEAKQIVPGDLRRQEDLIGRWNRDGKEDPRFTLTLSPQLGWDSNIVGLDPNTPITQGNVEFESYYVGAYLDARYFLLRNARQIVQLEYQAVGRIYPESTDLNFLDNLMQIVGRQPVADWADLELRGSLNESFIRDSGHFRTERTLGPGLLVQAHPDLQLRLFTDFTSASYYDDTPAEQDRDGNIYRVGVEGALDLGRGWTLSPYVTYTKYNAQGSDYDARGVEGGVTLRPEEFLGLKVSGTLLIADHSYANPNSLTGFTERRHDRPIQGTLTIIFKQIERMLGYAPALSITYVNHYSNIQEFKYHRWIPQIELGINVCSF